MSNFEGMKLCVYSPLRVLFQFPTRVIILDLEFLHLCTAIHSHFRFYIKHPRVRDGKFFTGAILNKFFPLESNNVKIFTWRKKSKPAKKSVSFRMCERGRKIIFQTLQACYSTLAQHFMI